MCAESHNSCWRGGTGGGTDCGWVSTYEITQIYQAPDHITYIPNLPEPRMNRGPAPKGRKARTCKQWEAR